MSNHVVMSCKDIRLNLKQFQEDLLVEEEYHAYILHLEGCSTCREYVRSIGTLSNQIWKLKDVKVPADLSANILFNIDKAEKGQAESPVLVSKKNIFIALILIFVLLMIIAAVKYFQAPEYSSEINAGRTESAPLSEKGDGHLTEKYVEKRQNVVRYEQAEYLYQQLEEIAETLEPMTKDKAVEKQPQKVSLSEGKPDSFERSPALDVNENLEKEVAIVEVLSLHWHIPISKEEEMKQLADTVKILEIKPDYDDKKFLIFKATGKQLKILIKGIQFGNKLQLDIPDFSENESFSDQEISVSIVFVEQQLFDEKDPELTLNQNNDVFVSLENKISLREQMMDWHVLLIPSQQDVLLNIIRQGGGMIDYISPDISVFSAHGAKVEKIAEKIKNTGGVFADFGKIKFDKNFNQQQMTNVLVYFKKQ